MARNKKRKKSETRDPGVKKTAPKKPLKPEQPSSSSLISQNTSAGAEIKAESEMTQAAPRLATESAGKIDGQKPPLQIQDSSPKKTQNLVRLSTCMAGMFLTFVLGLYLGSLLPGIIQGMEEEKHSASRALETRPAPAPPSAPEATAQKPVQEKSEAIAEQGSIRHSIPREILEHIRHLEKDAASHPDDSRIWTELGNAYFDIHEPRNAISAYEHSLSLAPSNPDVLTDLGIMYREIRNYDKALECFRQAQQQDPGHINAIFNEGVVLSSDLGRKTEAAQAWTRILAIDPAAATPDGQKIADMVRQLQ